MNIKRTAALNVLGLALALLPVAALPTAASAQATSYTFTNFNGIGDFTNGTTINAINNAGDVLGFSTGANSNIQNFYLTPFNTFVALPTLTTPAMANAINDSLQVTGANGADAFLLNAFTATDVPLPLAPAKPGATASEVALGINDNGVIVGQYADSVTGTSPGFIDINGSFTILTPMPNSTVTNPQGITNNEFVVGFTSNQAGGAHSVGFLYNALTGAYSFPKTPPIPQGVANLNFVQLLAVNSKQLVAGYYQTNDGSQHGLLYNTSTGAYKFLDDPGVPTTGTVITQITGINDAGELCGFYISPANHMKGFIAIPNTPTITGFSPASGVVGTTVTITGSGFTGTTVVGFQNAHAKSFTINGTGTLITTTVPMGAVTGPIAILTPNGEVKSVTNFTVN